MKVWCIPLDKHLGTFQWKCQEKEQGPVMMSNQFLMAQQAVIEECGLLDITVKVRSARRLFMSTEKKQHGLAETLLIHTLCVFQVWIAPVNAVVPGTGLHIWWYGLWMQRAEGISINQLSYITRKKFVEDTIMDLLQV